MNGITVPMAIVDFMPVAFFFIAAVVLQRDLYRKLSKGAFAILAAGSIMVLAGGLYKATWKILYALNVCDFVALNQSFFPMQAPGFMLVFIALTSLFRKNSDCTSTTAMAIVPAVYTSNLIFIIMQVAGYGGIQFSLVALARRMRKAFAAVLFVLAFIFILGMGYLGAKFDDSSSMHWLAQLTNNMSQGCFCWGVMILHRAGLADFEIVAKKD